MLGFGEALVLLLALNDSQFRDPYSRSAIPRQIPKLPPLYDDLQTLIPPEDNGSRGRI